MHVESGHASETVRAGQCRAEGMALRAHPGIGDGGHLVLTKDAWKLERHGYSFMGWAVILSSRRNDDSDNRLNGVNTAFCTVWMTPLRG